MIKRLLYTLLLLYFTSLGIAQDTFSIVAVDSVTGEIGSAGATCLAGQGTFQGAVIISEVIPGRGAIHTQALWNPDNQYSAMEYMLAGFAPQAIIDSLVKYDAEENPQVRQYGIVDLVDRHPRSAAFTGTECNDYKNHKIGPNYAIQGNILLGQQILDSMEARFLRTEGTLSDKLMAAMQGANVRGADTRCYDSLKSSASSFIRLAKPADEVGEFYLELIVPRTAGSRDPIDSLQTLFDAWKSGASVERYSNAAFTVLLQNKGLVCRNISMEKFSKVEVEISDVVGRTLLRTQMTQDDFTIPLKDITGVCFVKISSDNDILYAGKFIIR